MRRRLASWTAAEQVQLPLQFAFGAVARSFHLIANPRANTFPQRRFQPNQFVFALRTQIHFQACFVRHGIDRSAALNLSQVEGGTRSGWYTGIDEPYCASYQRVNWIGNPKIR